MLVCSFNKEKVLVGAFSGNCEIREGSFRALLGNHPRVRLIGVSVICDTLISSLNHTGLCSRHGKITCNYSSNLTAAKEVAPPNCRKRLKIVICTVARQQPGSPDTRMLSKIGWRLGLRSLRMLESFLPPLTV